MTNDKTVTMSRELAEYFLHCGDTNSSIAPAMTAKLRALLAAPAVERQEPVAWRVTGRGGLTLTPQYPEWAVGEGAEGLIVEPLYTSPSAPVAVVLPPREVMRDLIAEVIGGDAYDCVRVWSAWGVGTMSEDDFVPIVEQEDRLYELADACLDKVKEMNE